jgi:hypothetical protein
MILHLAARKDAIAMYLLPQHAKHVATYITGRDITLHKQPKLIWLPYCLSIATHELLMQLKIDVVVQ